MSHFGKGTALGMVLGVMLSAALVALGLAIRSHAGPAVTTGQSPMSSPAPQHGRTMLPEARATRSTTLPALQVVEAPPPAGASPRISGGRALTLAGARHEKRVTTARPVLMLFTDSSLRLANVLAWDVQETGCFPLPTPRSSPGQPVVTPAPCAAHQDVIVNAKTGARIEILNS